MVRSVSAVVVARWGQKRESVLTPQGIWAGSGQNRTKPAALGIFRNPCEFFGIFRNPFPEHHSQATF
eukprot:7118480-Pyramimonas_sp.AAC.1